MWSTREGNGKPLQYSCLENPMNSMKSSNCTPGHLLPLSTNGYCFCFGSIPSFFLELFLHWSLVAYWAPTDLGSSSFSILSFCLFQLFMGFSRQEYWSGLPFPSPLDHILSDLSTMTRLSWKGQFSFQSQRKAMPRNAQTTAQLHSSHTLLK